MTLTVGELKAKLTEASNGDDRVEVCLVVEGEGYDIDRIKADDHNYSKLYVVIESY